VLKRYHGETGGASFDVLPAIDLREGRVVRLVEGDFGRETSYSDDPAAVAESFVASGARWVHLVDLDAARTGERTQARAIDRVVAAVGARARCQVAGGIRSPETAAALLHAGAARIVVGTAALRDPAFAAGLVAAHGPDRIAAAIDVRDGMALGDGWEPGAAGLEATDAVHRLADAGVETFIVTAIDRDGRLEGPDLRLLESVLGVREGAVIASGGISSVDDLARVRDLGCSGAIVGRALYEGRLDVRSALAFALGT
jgi:phosphoribosylformimino-5-aminoimidazole carboxamide ribotide isomerase